jgi:protein O-GlcNAc transferase
MGTTFASRVAASLLNAADVPELITRSLDEYARLAALLTRDATALQSMTCALFDTHRFRRHIEAAYNRMWGQHQRGDAPRSFSVEPIRVMRSG